MRTAICVGYILPDVTNLGPGRRIGLWVRGCTLGCPGCIAPELALCETRYDREISDVYREIEALAADHDGITISGGEPFQQAGPLALLLSALRSETTLDIMVYSGYTLEEIQNGPREKKELLKQVDILVDGRYERESANRKIWRGSDNQQIHLLSERVRRYAANTDAEYGHRRPVRLDVGGNGEFHIIGIPDKGFAEKFEEAMRRKGIILRKNR
ncbi:MAG: 4Fe-4S single cluster domain-containing protein [Bacillota bacterium]|nr:4Fe-4S single cluster domain-containing protein [Bacillota bacterium]MDW7685000.1 4Fe-4S single cluster domain-containing protein [Bacillota bacterium]